MVKSFFWFLIGMIVGGVGVTGAMRYHVIRTDDNVHLVAKSIPEFRDTYVDIRDFDVEQWQKHPHLALALSQSGKPALLNDAAKQSAENAADALWQKMTQ